MLFLVMCEKYYLKYPHSLKEYGISYFGWEGKGRGNQISQSVRGSSFISLYSSGSPFILV